MSQQVTRSGNLQFSEGAICQRVEIWNTVIGGIRFSDRFAGHPVGDFHIFAGFEEIMELERKFMPAEKLSKQEGPVGRYPQAAEQDTGGGDAR